MPLLALLIAWLVQAAPALRPDPPHSCGDCAETRPRQPFKVFGNTYYVGTEGLGSILITNGGGSILIDGGMTQSAPLIDANIRALGFKTTDIRLIVASHAHYDHVGGIAALQRVSKAEVAALPAQRDALRTGEPRRDDPQFGFGRTANGFPVVSRVTAIADGATLRVGDLAITAHAVPGHTPGSTAWTWRSCEGTRCYDIAYVDSLNAISSPGFRFTGDASHPSLVDRFRKSIETTRDLPCDIILGPHASFTNLDAKIAARAAGTTPDPFVAPDGCRSYAADAGTRLDARIATELSGKH